MQQNPLEIINLDINQLLRDTVAAGASDLFLSSGAYVHVRIDGRLKAITSEKLPPGATQNLVEQLLNEAQLQELMQKHELNIGHVEPSSGRFRINLFKQRGELAIVARHIKSNIPSLETLGIPTALKHQIMQPNGLILIVGATGMGKSTTLASLINHRGCSQVNHIITLEDPIEYTYRHGHSIINQREIGLDTDSWHEAMKNTLRQSPDMVVIGEIRNRDAMEHAIAIANTGHMCLATLHATNARQAFERIVNMFPREYQQQELYDLAHCLRAILCQRLIPGLAGGRQLATECLINTRTVSDLIKQGDFSTIRDIMEKSEQNGMYTFDASLLHLYKLNKISQENALLYADSENDMRLKIQVEAGTPTSDNHPSLNLRVDGDDATQNLYRPLPE